MQPRIGFRDLRLKDAKNLYMIYADEDVSKFRGSNSMKTINDAVAFIKNAKKNEGEALIIRQGVDLLKENKLIGSIMIRIAENKKNEYEIGYSIGKQFWGQGLGTEIIRLLLKKIQENDKVENVLAWCHMNNTASIKILKKNGFRQVENNTIQKNYLYRKTLK